MRHWHKKETKLGPYGVLRYGTESVATYGDMLVIGRKRVDKESVAAYIGAPVGGTAKEIAAALVEYVNDDDHVEQSDVVAKPSVTFCVESFWWIPPNKKKKVKERFGVVVGRYVDTKFDGYLDEFPEGAIPISYSEYSANKK